MQKVSDTLVDLFFGLQGQHIPVDHGYALYGAVSRLLEKDDSGWLHVTDTIAIHPVRGQYLGDNELLIEPRSRLGFRVPVANIPDFLPLAGKAVEVSGHHLRVGVCTTHALQPVTALYSHLVTTRNGQDESRFDAEIVRQLDGLAIKGKPVRGDRRILTIKDHIIVGHALLVTDLTADESIRLQEQGLGGRRKMGCGIFVPVQTGANDD